MAVEASIIRRCLGVSVSLAVSCAMAISSIQIAVLAKPGLYDLFKDVLQLVWIDALHLTLQ